MERTSRWARLLTWAVLVAIAALAFLPGAGLTAPAPPATPAAPNAVAPEIVLVDLQLDIEVLRLIGAAPQMVWNSATSAGAPSGWTNFATGDFNHDADHFREIVGIKVDDSNGQQRGVLHVFQPMLNTTQPVQLDRTLEDGQTYHLLATGDFEGLGRDQIIAAYDYSSGGTTYEQLVEYFPQNDAATSWATRLVGAPYASTWQIMIAGDVNGDNRAELVMARNVDKDVLIQTGQSGVWSTLWESNAFCSDCNWYNMAIGRVFNDPTIGGKQLVMQRDSSSSARNSTLIFTWDGSTMVDRTPGNAGDWFFVPNFNDLALAKLDSTTAPYSEIVQLRQVPYYDPSNPNKPFAAMANPAGAPVNAFEPFGDYDPSSWLRIAAGDLNGDGRDELALLRPGYLRIYDRPWLDTHSLTDLRIDNVPTNLEIANIGVGGPMLGVSPLTLPFSAGRGAIVPAQNVSVSNVTPSVPFGWNAQVTSGAAWIHLNKTTGTATYGPTPDTFAVTVDSLAAPLQGLNVGAIRVWTNNALVLNADQSVTVNFTVGAPVFQVTPLQLTYNLNYGASATQPLAISTGAGNANSLSWTADSIGGNIPWLKLNGSADHAAGVGPGTLNLTVDSTLVGLAGASRSIHIVGQVSGVTIGSADVPITVNVTDDGLAVKPGSVALWRDRTAGTTSSATINVMRPAGSPLTWTAVAVETTAAAQLRQQLADGRARLTAQGLLVDNAPVAAPAWLSITPNTATTGTDAGTATTVVHVTALPAQVPDQAGIYRATIYFLPSGNPPGSIKTVDVTFVVSNNVSRQALPMLSQ